MPLEILVVPSQKVVGGSNVWVRGPYDDQNHVWFCGWHGNMPDDKWWETAPRRWSLIGWERWTLDTDMMNKAYYNYHRPGEDIGCAPGVAAEGHSSYIYGRLPHSVQYHPNATIKDPDLRYFDKGGGKGKRFRPSSAAMAQSSSAAAKGRVQLLRARASWDTRIGTATRDRERLFLRATKARARRMPRATKFKARARTMFREIRIGAAIGDRERVRLKARARARLR